MKNKEDSYNYNGNLTSLLIVCFSNLKYNDSVLLSRFHLIKNHVNLSIVLYE